MCSTNCVILHLSNIFAASQATSTSHSLCLWDGIASGGVFAFGALLYYVVCAEYIVGYVFLTQLLCVVLCCAVLCCAVLCCAVLCCAVLCCAVLYCAVLCCAVLCFVLIGCGKGREFCARRSSRKKRTQVCISECNEGGGRGAVRACLLYLLTVVTARREIPQR